MKINGNGPYCFRILWLNNQWEEFRFSSEEQRDKEFDQKSVKPGVQNTKVFNLGKYKP